MSLMPVSRASIRVPQASAGSLAMPVQSNARFCIVLEKISYCIGGPCYRIYPRAPFAFSSAVSWLLSARVAYCATWRSAARPLAEFGRGCEVDDLTFVNSFATFWKFTRDRRALQSIVFCRY
jgi:hypothetical protein